MLLGFAATDFMITMTLSAADATAHLVENPHLEPFLTGHQVVITLLLLALLGGVFLRGFQEAIGVAVILVAVYLSLNVVVIAVAFVQVAAEPYLWSDWETALTQQHGSPLVIVGIALLVFPKLALGLSGFETGVAVMPHINGDPDDTPGTSGRSHPWRKKTADHGRSDHEHFLDHEQYRHHTAHPAGGVPTWWRGQRASAGLPGP